MVGIAVLGAGRIGKIHAANVAANPNARLIAVADPYASAAQSLAGALGADAMTDCEAAIDRNDVDAIVIGTPTNTHIQLMMRAVRQGKAVLCEKPIDLDLLKSQAAVEEIEGLNGRVMLAFNRRFETTFAAMREAIIAGEIGEVRQVIISSRDPGLGSKRQHQCLCSLRPGLQIGRLQRRNQCLRRAHGGLPQRGDRIVQSLSPGTGRQL